MRDIGLCQGCVVVVHSALSSLGWVDGGASTVVDALMAVVSPQGTIVMPASALSLPLPLSQEDRRRGIRAKVRLYGEGYEGKTGMGAIADDFRNRTETVLGPGAYTVAAWGNEAETYCLGWNRLLDHGGMALLIGVDIHRLSCMHAAEARVGVPEAIRRYSVVPEEILRDYPPDEWYIECGEPPEDGWAKIQDQAERSGLITRGRIGIADCMFFNAWSVVSIYEESLRTAPYELWGVPLDD